MNKSIEDIRQEITSAGETVPAVQLTSAALRQSIYTQEKLNELKLPPREKIIGDFGQEGAIGYLFAPRGEGKTWMALHLAKCLGAGANFGPYEVSQQWPVLYIDGEMNVRSLQDRINSLPNDSENLHLLSSDLLWRQLPNSFRGLDLNDGGFQEVLLKTIDEIAPKVVIIDNLSCTFYGMNENEASDWEKAMPFLAQLKHRGILIIILHHTTKKGDEMRGTSKREDQADFIIRLSKLDDGTKEKGTLRLKTEFRKNRNCEVDEEHDELAWVFALSREKKAEITHRVFNKKQQVLLAIQRGITSCREIAEELNISFGYVSDISKELRKAGKIRKEGGGYYPVDSD